MILPPTRKPVTFRYNHWFLRRVWRFARGMTLGHTVLFKYPQSEISYQTHVHELFHIRQVEANGFLKFYSRYFWLLARHGYRKHPLELEVVRQTEEWVKENSPR
jgi:hypothetical protein